MNDDQDFRRIDVMEELAEVESTDVLNPNDLVHRVAQARQRKFERCIEMPWAKLDKTRFALRPREVCLLGGFSGHFKSTVSTQIALGAIRQGYRVGIASLELPAEDVIESFCDIAAASNQPPMDWVSTFASWADQKLFLYDRTDGISPESAIQLTIAFKKFFGCDLVILDALMMMGVCQDPEKEQAFTQTINRVAKSFDMHVMLVHHMRKPEGRDGESRMPDKASFIGSSHIVNVSQNIVIVWHDKDKAAKFHAGALDPIEDAEKPDFKLHVAKQRGSRFEGRVALWQHKNSRGFCGTPQRLLKPMEFHSTGGLRQGWEPLH